MSPNRYFRHAERNAGQRPHEVTAVPCADPYATIETITRVNLVEAAFEALRDSILTGRLFSGQRLVETELARELGISRGPLREALTLLQKDGLVEVLPRRGRFVLVFTEHAVDEFYSLRKVMEAYAVERVIMSLDGGKMTLLASAQQQVEVAEKTGIPQRAIAADLEFHELFYELAGHQLLRQTWSDNMASKLRLLLHVTVPDDFRPDTNASNHRLLVNAIGERDVLRARTLVAEHIEDARLRARRAVANQAANQVARSRRQGPRQPGSPQ